MSASTDQIEQIYLHRIYPGWYIEQQEITDSYVFI